MCAFVCTQDNGDCVNRAVSVPQFSPEATPLRGECQLVKKKIYTIYIYIYIYLDTYILMHTYMYKHSYIYIYIYILAEIPIVDWVWKKLPKLYYVF